MSDSGIGFSVKRFVIFIVLCAIAILVFEGMGEVGGNMIKDQVSRTTSKFHPEKNVEDRIKPAFVLEDKVAVASAASDSDPRRLICGLPKTLVSRSLKAMICSNSISKK